jgi:hypothetical protein
MAIDDTPHNKDVIQGWIAKWYPFAIGDAEAFASAFHGKLQPPHGGVAQRANEHYRDYLGAMNLHSPRFESPQEVTVNRDPAWEYTALSEACPQASANG